jgi:hypothetical protein
MSDRSARSRDLSRGSLQTVILILIITEYNGFGGPSRAPAAENPGRIRERNELVFR